MQIPQELRCFDHMQPFELQSAEGYATVPVLVCAVGCRVPCVNNVPRFTRSDNYASGFGLQWNHFRKTQLDSYTGTTISRDRLERCLGGSLDIIKGKSVLEVGCGAGRFTEIMLAAGANIFACDLSEAVEANYENCHRWPNYFVCQADMRQLPIEPHSFDVVLCLGVIQHTPNSEETIAELTRYLKPGGTLVIDHYAHAYPHNGLQKYLRALLIRLSAGTAKSVTLLFTRLLLPLHRLSWSDKRGRWRVRRFLKKYSPVIDYYEAYPQLGKRLLAEWALLDTHDTLTDHYKHFRSVDEIENCLKACGLEDLVVYYGGNGVEARARMPLLNDNRKRA
jgi:2-polyprenyl-3-methyl-5-hydroxy-6-metoxy-1,4-benzoquinol methylase